MASFDRRPGAITRGGIAALCALLVFSGLVTPAEARSYDPEKIDPLLAQQALADPDAEFAVIVRVSSRAAHGAQRAAKARDLIRENGGRSKFALGIIGGEAAQVSGRAAIALSRNPHVEYVFRDAA